MYTKGGLFFLLLTFTRMLLMKTRVLSLPNSIRLFSFLILFFQIVMELPRRFRGAEPQLLYSTQKHGISQRTFFHKAKNYPFTLLVIKDTKGHVRKQMAVLREKKEKKKKVKKRRKRSVAYVLCVDFWWVCDRAMENLTAEVLRHRRKFSLHPPTNHAGKRLCLLFRFFAFFLKNFTTLQIFRWSHLNDYFMYSDEKCIGFGGGGAGFGLWIDHGIQSVMIQKKKKNESDSSFILSEFNVGASKASATYLNTTLSSTLDFTCLHLELWAVRPFA